jgi:uncharacterized protein
MKAYLTTTGIIFGLLAVTHLMRTINHWHNLAADPWFVLGTSAETVVTIALSLWAWCVLLALKPQVRQTEQEEKRNNGSGVGANLARHGGLSYLEIPAVNPRQSAVFYEKVLGWNLRERNTDDPRFDNGTGHLIGRWVTGRPISRESGLLPYIYVNHIDDAVERIAAHGGEVIKPPCAEGDTWVAPFRDPAGNVLGLWQEVSR